MSSQKTPEELKKEQAEAKAQLDAMFAQSKPKNLAQGVGTGISNIVSGAVGGAGVAVMAPTAGLAMGMQNGGIIGGAIGAAGGAVVGVLGAATMVVGGTVSGVSQIVRGIAATPEAMTAPKQGKWWNDQEDRWVFTDMTKEAEALNAIPADDSDILGGIQSDLDQGKTDDNLSTEVKDTILYDALGVPPDADPCKLFSNVSSITCEVEYSCCSMQSSFRDPVARRRDL